MKKLAAALFLLTASPALADEAKFIWPLAIKISGWFSGASITATGGYNDEAKCEEARKAVLAKAAKDGAPITAFCLPVLQQ